jgi:hypothetical protein
MQTPKVSLVICALALVATVTVRATDNAAQAAARAALVAKLFEVGAATPTNPPPAVIKPAVIVVAAPVVNNVPAVAPEPVLIPVSGEARAKAKAKAKADKLAAEAKAKAADEQAAADKKAQKAAAKLAAAKKSEAAVAAQTAAPASVKIEPAPLAKVVPAPKMMAAANGDNPAQAAARAALAQKLFESSQTQSGWEAPSQKPIAKPTKPVAKVEKPKPAAQPVPVALAAPAAPKSNFATTEPSLKPIEAPASPLPTSKQQKLQALLVKYTADQITPEEYHQQRTAILAEP